VHFNLPFFYIFNLPMRAYIHFHLAECLMLLRIYFQWSLCLGFACLLGRQFLMRFQWKVPLHAGVDCAAAVL